jgi:hypothetical protein
MTRHAQPVTAAAPPGRPYFLISIDTEGDDAWSRTRQVTTRNARFLPRFQALCEAHGLRPTYLTNYEMARCPDYVAFARDVLRRGAAEVGMHLHAWDSPPLAPLTADDTTYHPYAFEYPEPVLRDKVHLLTDLLEDTFGVPMLSHRAGRWGFSAGYARILAARGYRVDCSVTPNTSWQKYQGDPAGKGGPDFTGFPEHAYFLDLDDIRRPGASGLLEVPMTVMRHPHLRAEWLHRLVAKAPRLLRAPVNRLFPPVVRLQPNGRNLRHLRRVLRAALEEGRDHVQFTLHSSEFMPGGSPLFGTERSIERLYRHLEVLFADAARHFRGATLTEYHAGFCKGAGRTVIPAPAGREGEEAPAARNVGPVSATREPCPTPNP